LFPDQLTDPSTLPQPALLNRTVLLRPRPDGSSTSRCSTDGVKSDADRANLPSYALCSETVAGALNVLASRCRIESTGDVGKEMPRALLDVVATMWNCPPVEFGANRLIADLMGL